MNFWKKWFAKHKDHPPFIRNYLDHFSDKPLRITPIKDIRFVVFDTETSGLDVQKSQLLSLGAVTVQDAAIIVEDSLELLVRRPKSQINEQVAIHGILQKELQEGLDERQTLQDWLEYIGNAMLVAHHAAFDLGILNRICSQHFGIKLKNDSIDTALLAKRLEHGTQLKELIKDEEYTLDRLCKRYGIVADDRHTAAGDAFITAQLLLKLLSKARKRGIKTYGELIR